MITLSEKGPLHQHAACNRAGTIVDDMITSSEEWPHAECNQVLKLAAIDNATSCLTN